MNLFLISILSFQCMLNSLETASKVGIKRDWSYVTLTAGVDKNRKHLENLLKETWGKGDPDPRMFAISWLESRLRPVTYGDRGRACGIFQIHARYSYPLFRRKGGFMGWDEKENSSRHLVKKECRRLLKLKYSVDTMKRLLSMMDDRGLHVCHHNSGFGGRCNTWYKERVSFWVSYFSISKWLCTKKGE